MGTRTVRLDQDAERTLSKLRKATGLSISEQRQTQLGGV
jgi:hypothetical protein